MTSIGKPKACSASAIKFAELRATRRVLVATALTLLGSNPRKRSPKR